MQFTLQTSQKLVNLDKLRYDLPIEGVVKGIHGDAHTRANATGPSFDLVPITVLDNLLDLH